MASHGEDRAPSLSSLKQQINDLEHQIHVLEFPPRDRTQLPKLRNALRALEKKIGHTELDSPTWRAGAPACAEFTRVTLDVPWMDAPAVQSVPELKTFHGQAAQEGSDNTFVATATMPGADVVVTYDDGVLVQAVLRGDGRQGDDVTDNVRTILSVPLRLKAPGTQTESRVTKPTGQAHGPSTTTPVPPYPRRLQVRMTVALRNADLTALDRRRVDAGDPPYVSARGAAINSLRRLESRITASRRLRAFAIGCPTTPTGIETQWQLLGALKSWGFAIQPVTWRCRGLQEVLDFVAALQQLAPTFDYPLEGGLLVTNRLNTSAPAQARLTFPPPGRPALVERLYYAVGRGGSILPVGLIGKVPEHDLPVPERAPVPAVDGQSILPVATGARIRVRPGSVAPIMTLQDAGVPPRSPLMECPACRGRLQVPADQPFQRCVNASCPGRARARLLHLIGPRGLRIGELTVKSVDRLLQELGPIDVVDFFTLEAPQIDRFAPGRGARIVGLLAEARRMPLWRFLYLSAISHVSEHEARIVVRHVRSVERLQALSPIDVDRIEGLSPEAARGLATWLRTEGPRTLGRAQQAGMTLLGDDEAFSAPFLDKTIVVAGEIEGGGAQLIDEIERRGGIIQTRVGRDTDLVIVGKSAQKTFDTAIMYGVPVLDEDAVEAVLRETGARNA